MASLPEDSERLLVRPLEQQLRNIEGLKEMVGSATENRGSVTLEFEPEVNVDEALQTCASASTWPRPSCRWTPRSRASTKSSSRASIRCW